MRRGRAASLLAIAVLAGCGGDAGTLVVVTVSSTAPLSGVQSVQLTATGGGRSKSFTVASPTATIPPAITVGIDVPPSVTGQFTVKAVVLGANGSPLAMSDQSFALVAGQRNDVTVDVTPTGGSDGGVDMTGADLAGADLAGADLSSGPDLIGYTPVCGNGIRDPLEGCDDGNTVDGDGCSPTCVIEPEYKTPFVGTALSPLNGGWLAVAQSGVSYVKSSGGGGSKDSIYKIDTAGTVTANALSGALSAYAGDIRAVGNDIYNCGNYIDTATPQNNHTTCQKWAGGAGTPTIAFDEVAIGYFYAYATSDGATWWFATENVSPTDFRKSTDAQHTIDLSTSLQGALVYHPTLGILIADGGIIMKDTGGAGTGPFTTAYTLAAGNISVMAVDRNDNLWVTCTTGGAVCPSGSVWIVDLATMQAKPAIDNFGIAQSIGYDATAHEMILLSGGKLWRFAN